MILRRCSTAFRKLSRTSVQRVETLLVVVSLCLGLVPAAAQDDPTPRNVVLILSDDHRYDFMGFMPEAPPFLRTPALDRMAAGGAHLRNAFVTTSLCSPSRASILTGRYAHRHGVVDNQRAVPPGTRFFPQDLQAAGYETAFVGKWHMGSASDEPRPGFDHWVSFRGQGDYENPTLNVNGIRGQVEGYTTDILTDHAVDWLQRERDRPFFLYLSHKAVHGPFTPAPRHRGAYAGVEPDYPASIAPTDANYRKKPKWVYEQRYGWHGVNYMSHGREDFDTRYRRYSETLLALDESVGRVLDALAETGLDSSTVVIYMGDNGYSLGEQGLVDKRQMYESSIRIPMLAWAPGLIEPGTNVDEMVANIDVAPTFLDLAGASPAMDMDGRSFAPLLRGRAIPWREALLYTYYWEWNYPHTPTTLGVRTDRWKYVFYYGLWDLNELYDLEADPEERRNLIDEPEHAERVAAMRDRLFDMLEATDGMQIPLRRPAGTRRDISLPDSVRGTAPDLEGRYR